MESFESKIVDPKSSNLWKFVFFGLKNIQTVVLIILFINGSDHINNLENLGYMLFFVIYTTYEKLYRKTSKLLTIFISFIIFGQYFFSLTYHFFRNDPILMRRFEWFSFYEQEKQPNWEPGSSIYFRHTPYGFAIFVLLLMNVLNSINTLYIDTKRVQELEIKCYEGLRNEYSSSVYVYVRIKNFFSRIFIYVGLAMLLFFLGKVQTNIFSSLLFMLNIIMLAFFAKGDSKTRTIRQMVWISNAIKVTSSFMLVIEIFFISFIGEKEKVDQPDSLDQYIKNTYPFLYKNFDTIGFRIFVDEYFSPVQQ
jgi:hypothetical protein